MPNRVLFLVDGFNIYHSVRDIMRKNQGWVGLKWLNIDALCRSLLPHLGKGAQMAGVHYFTALAHHRTAQDATTVQRHEAFIAALESTGVVVHRGEFKDKDIGCPVCGVHSVHHEEKQTDVSIGVTLLELLFNGLADTAVVVTGDTDLVPAFESAKRLFPTARLVAAFPYGRGSKQLRQIAHKCIKLRQDAYRAALFPVVVPLPSGGNVTRPASWAVGHQARARLWGRRTWPVRHATIRFLCAVIRSLRR